MNRNTGYDFWDWMMLIGGVWMLTKIFKNASNAGIGSLPGAYRKLKPYKDNNGKDLFLNDLKKATKEQRTAILELVAKSRLAPLLKKPIYDSFAGNKYIDGEFRDVASGARIFVTKLTDGNFAMVSFYFKEKGHATPTEVKKAEGRIKNYADFNTR